MVKVSWEAGHGINTPGKRSPDDEREWLFNSKVGLAFDAELKRHGVNTLRCDDPSGKEDVPLVTRVNRANNYGSDIHVSIHHNANTSKWGNWGGTETFTYEGSNPKSEKLAKFVHPKLVKAMGLRDRGIKKGNLYMLRKTNMPAILTEACFMDSLSDIKKLRDDSVLKQQGIAIAHGVLEYFGIPVKTEITSTAPVSSATSNLPEIKTENKGDEDELFKLDSATIKAELRVFILRLTEKEPGFDKQWLVKYDNGSITNSEMIMILMLALKRNMLDIQG